MRGFYLFILILLLPVFIYGKGISKNIHGFINDKGEKLFDIEGYAVTVYETKGMLEDEAAVRLIERTYNLDYSRKTYVDSTLGIKNKIIESSVNKKEWPFQISQKCILLQIMPDIITILYLETSIDRDLKIEEEILKAYLNGQLNRMSTPGNTTASITLAGKVIHLPVTAEWIAPQKIVDEDSQLSWFEFSSTSRAKQYLSNQQIIDRSSNVEFIKEDEISIILDSKSFKSHRVVYRDLSDESLADYLIAYYIEGKLRGRNVVCILSYSGHSPEYLYLPPLLGAVMQIASVSDSKEQDLQREYPFYSVNSFKTKNKYNQEYNYFYAYRFEIQLGSVLPFGNLRDVYPMAPSLGMYISIPLFYRLGLDGGFQGAIPIESGFDYYYSDGSVEKTKATGVLGINMRGRYLLHQTRDWIFSGYLGVGGNWLFTNIINEEAYNWETDTYNKYAVSSLDVFVGCNVSYKKFGLFVEYHLTPYGNSNKVKYDFGKNSFNVGLTFTTGWDL